MKHKFTQEIKDLWLTALKSGKYTQIKNYLKTESGHCCIGVLGDILNNKGSLIKECPYTFLGNNINWGNTQRLWELNDDTFNPRKPDYSNVIPMIESLPV